MNESLHFAVGSKSMLSVNDDAAYAGSHLLALASGLSTEAGPGVPAGVTIETLRSLDTDIGASKLVRTLGGGLERVDKALRSLIKSDELLRGMATSLTVMLWSGRDVAVAHIGDSRAYVMRKHELSQITRDHTVAQLLLDDGEITTAELMSDPRSSWLIRVINGSDNVEADLNIRRAEIGDRYLLCSRGLWRSVSAQAISHILTSASTPQEAVDVLVQTARERESHSTVTCVVADIIAQGHQPQREPMTAGAALQHVTWPND